jgi:hypothetical protein
MRNVLMATLFHEENVAQKTISKEANIFRVVVK